MNTRDIFEFIYWLYEEPQFTEWGRGKKSIEELYKQWEKEEGMNSVPDGDPGTSPMSPYYQGEPTRICENCGREVPENEMKWMLTEDSLSLTLCSDCYWELLNEQKNQDE